MFFMFNHKLSFTQKDSKSELSSIMSQKSTNTVTLYPAGGSTDEAWRSTINGRNFWALVNSKYLLCNTVPLASAQPIQQVTANTSM